MPRTWCARTITLLALAQLVACGASAPPASTAADSAVLPTIPVSLPNGTLIEAELAITAEDQARGLMFRRDLAADRGMLFVGDRASRRSFWMYQCYIPLDMVWMDGARRIVEIVHDAPPCRESDPQRCPSYGGGANSVYVLELRAGQARAQGLALGQQLTFEP